MLIDEAHVAESAYATAAGEATVEQEKVVFFLLVAVLVMLVTAANFLRLNEHAFFQVDSLFAIGALAATAAPLSALYLWNNLYWRAVLQALLSFLAIDMLSSELRIAAIVSALVAAFVIVKRKSLLLPAAVFLGVMLIASVAGVGSVAPFKSERTRFVRAGDAVNPTIVHLILDEHVGIAGLQNPDEDPAKTRARITAEYSGMGFRIYGRAFSEHFHTVNALPWAMNLGAPVRYNGGKGGVRVNQNRYFDSLQAAGYRVKVAQTAFANFCGHGAVVSCTTYNQQSLGAVRRYDLNTVDRTALIYFKILDQSAALLGASRLIDQASATRNREKGATSLSTLKRKSRSNTLAGLAAMDDLIHRLKRARLGEMYFAHILMPHTPYVLRNDCTVRRFRDWDDRDSPSTLEIRQRRYLDQISCAARKVRETVKALDNSPAAKSYIVIVHGDHGSRLTRTDPNEESRGMFGPSDMVAGFSTLFAVKARGIPAGYDANFASVADLLAELSEEEFKAAPSARRSKPVADVLLDDDNWKPTGSASLPSNLDHF